MAKPFVHPGTTTRLSSGVHTSAKLHSRSSCTSEVNGRYIRTPDSSWGHTMCHLTQFPVPGSGRRQMPRIQSNSRANWSLLWCARCQRPLWPLTIHDSASPWANGGFCLFNNCVLSPLSFHHPPHLCQAACLGITWRIATTSSFWPATRCPPLTLVHVSKQWAINPYSLSSCQSWFYRQVIRPLSAIPFPDQGILMAVVCTPDCHRWFLASFSGSRGHQAVLGALARHWHAADQGGDRLALAGLSPALAAPFTRQLGTSLDRSNPDQTYLSCRGCCGAGFPPSSQSGWLCWRRGPIPVQEVAAPANGEWWRPQWPGLGEEAAGWLPGAGSWLRGGSHGESRQAGSQQKPCVGKKTRTPWAASAGRPQTPDLPEAPGSHEACACKVLVRATRTMVRYQACVQKLLCTPHLHYISFTHDTSFSNNPSCVICLFFFFFSFAAQDWADIFINDAR